MHWCYIDESWRDGPDHKIGVLAATVGTAKDFQRLDRVMYRLRRKYISDENAKNRSSELKGTQLLGNNSFKMQEKHNLSKNLCLARELLEFVPTTSIRYIGVTVLAEKQPDLLAPDARDLSRPFKELCLRLEAAIPKNQKGIMVFDQRVGAQEGISVAIANYLSGMTEQTKLYPAPLVGVSNVHAGLQLADIAAFILGKHAAQDRKIEQFRRLLMKSQLLTETPRIKKLHGFVRLQHDAADDSFTIQRKR